MIAQLAGHLWTVGPYLARPFRPPAALPARLWQAPAPSLRYGEVTLSGLLSTVPGSSELLLLVHGLGGSAGSHYMVRTAVAALGRGVSVLRLNLRGADRHGEDLYHAGLTEDLDAALASPSLAGWRRIYLLGFSLGGHVALRWATGPGDPRVGAVGAVSTPLDLDAASRHADRPAMTPYRRYVLSGLREIYAAVAGRRPVPIPVAEAESIRTIRVWDEVIVAPHHGFAGAADYYRRASAGPRLGGLRLPALLVAAEVDPLLPTQILEPSLQAAGDRLEVRFVPRGGHLSFPPGLDLGFGGGSGLESQLVSWFRRCG